MKKLRESFRKAEDNNRTSGRGRISCRYYNELAEILAGRPETEPIGVVASAELEAPAAGENQHEEVIAMDQSSDEEGSEGDKTQDETLDASQDTPPELGMQIRFCYLYLFLSPFLIFKFLNFLIYSFIEMTCLITIWQWSQLLMIY